MNKLESAYSYNLQLRLAAGEILWWSYEPLKLRLADRTYYTPDFLVVARENTLAATHEGIEFHEVKGFMRDDAAVKLKVAAEMHPWARFMLVKRKNNSWEIRPVKSGSK